MEEIIGRLQERQENEKEGQPVTVGLCISAMCVTVAALTLGVLLAMCMWPLFQGSRGTANCAVAFLAVTGGAVIGFWYVYSLPPDPSFAPDEEVWSGVTGLLMGVPVGGLLGLVAFGLGAVVPWMLRRRKPH